MSRKKKDGPVNAGEVAKEITDAINNNQIGGDPAAPPVGTPAPKPPEKPKAKPVRGEIIKVRHDFDDKELLTIGGMLADKQRVYDHTESELKTIQRQFKTTMSGLKCDIDSCVDKIKDGYEMSDVEAVVMVCVDKKSNTATKCFYRKDDGSFIKDERAIRTELELFNVLPEKHDIKKPLPKKLLESQV